MFTPIKSARIAFALLALLLAGFSSTMCAASRSRVVRQATDEQVTLTVTSTCGSTRVKVKKRGVLTTPFSVTFPRGKTIKLKALDAELPQCGVVGVVAPFD